MFKVDNCKNFQFVTVNCRIRLDHIVKKSAKQTLPASVTHGLFKNITPYGGTNKTDRHRMHQTLLSSRTLTLEECE